MAFSAKEPRGCVKPNPSRAGQIDLGPGVQVGEVAIRAARPFDRIDVGSPLDQITGDEARRETEMTKDLHQQPGRVATGAGAERERLLRRLNAVLHADDVVNHVLQPGVELDEELNGSGLLA